MFFGNLADGLLLTHNRKPFTNLNNENGEGTTKDLVWSILISNYVQFLFTPADTCRQSYKKLYRFSSITNAVAEDCSTCHCSTNSTRLYNYKTNAPGSCEITDEVIRNILGKVCLTNCFLTKPECIGLLLRSQQSSSAEDICDAANNSILIEPNCEEMVNDILDLLERIVIEVEMIVDFIDDPDGYRGKYYELLSCVNCLNGQLDQIQSEWRTNHTEMMKQWEETVANFSQALNEKDETIRTLHEDLQTKIRETTFAYIASADFPSAHLVYMKISDVSNAIHYFVDKLANSRYLGSLLEFTQMLAFEGTQLDNKLEIYNETLKKFGEDDISWITIRNSLKLDLSAYCRHHFGTDPCNSNAQFYQVMSNHLVLANVFCSLVTGTHSKMIQNGDSKSLSNVLNGISPETLLFRQGYLDFLPDVLQEVVDNKKYDQALDFVSTLRWSNFSIAGFEKLLNFAQPSELLTTASQLKSATDNMNEQDPGNVTLNRYLTLKFKLPKAVQCIVWRNLSTFEAVENVMILEGAHYRFHQFQPNQFKLLNSMNTDYGDKLENPGRSKYQNLSRLAAVDGTYFPYGDIWNVTIVKDDVARVNLYSESNQGFLWGRNLTTTDLIPQKYFSLQLALTTSSYTNWKIDCENSP